MGLASRSGELKETGELPGRVRVRSSQYLNHLVEQDHRRIKQRIRPMLGLKRFDHAAVTISGVEVAEQIKKGQFKTGKFGNQKPTMSELWNAALAARLHLQTLNSASPVYLITNVVISDYRDASTRYAKRTQSD
jgi:hypothetical protein